MTFTERLLKDAGMSEGLTAEDLRRMASEPRSHHAPPSRAGESLWPKELAEWMRELFPVEPARG